ncbi:hypothetical protein NXW71_01995 [Parabacteroides merdae]|nr:hypothetical protein [Parabacteroides merdae]
MQVSFGKEQASCLKELKRQASEGCFVMPNADGKGYGFFRLLEKDAKACLGNLPACKDEVLRGSLLITLYENLLNRTIPAELYMEAMLDYLPTENNSLLFSAALGYIGNCQRFYLADPEKLELVLLANRDNGGTIPTTFAGVPPISFHSPLAGSGRKTIRALERPKSACWMFVERKRLYQLVVRSGYPDA